MNSKRTLRQVAVALLLLVAFLFQGTWALAGTTGSLSGAVTDDSGAPVSGAAVKVSSASQSGSATTDASGHFSFISLAPDTYTVSIEKDTYAPISYPGVTVFADQQQTLSFRMTKQLKQIAKVTSRAASLVRSGTTSDVYSVNAASQQAQAASAGGYNLNSAYSAVYNTPGVQGAIGNYGFGQVFFIRGSSYSQTGYEFDGVPVNRAFDNYNANSLSNLGQQELQVYTGGSPAGSSSATLGGFINQVIKTGTYPGSAFAEGGAGMPNFYHSAKIEAGGASPDRLFSYYVGISGYNQSYPWINNQNGGNLNPDGSNSFGLTGAEINLGGMFNLSSARGPWAECNGVNGQAPTNGAEIGGTAQCVSYLPLNTEAPYSNAQYIFDRESVLNFHFGIPHKKDGGRDDIQVLFDNFAVPQYFNDSLNGEGGLTLLNTALAQFAQNFGGSPTPTTGGVSAYPNLCSAYNSPLSFLFTFNPLTGGAVGCNTTGNPFTYADGAIFQPGTQFGQNAGTTKAIPYIFPHTGGNNRAAYSTIGTDTNGEIANDGSIVKVQYQKNISSNAYLRLFGYTFYSDWLQTDPTQGATLASTLGTVPDSISSNNYELNTHTRGLQADFADQINDKNLITLTGNYTTATVVRWNNYSSLMGSGYESQIALGMNSPTNFATPNGQCFDFQTGAPDTCYSGATSGTWANTLGSFCSANCGTPTAVNTAFTSGNPCTSGQNAALVGSPACTAGATTIVTTPGEYGLRNTVQPRFASAALTDEFRPTDKLDFNLGLRYENYQYNLENTDTVGNQFWFAAAANTYCYDSGTGQPILTAITPASPTQSPQILPNTVAGQNPALCYSPTTGLALSGPSGSPAVHPNGLNGNKLFSPVSPGSIDKNLWSPRIGGTYTINPDTVVRASYGRYTQPTETAFEQYTGPSGQFVSNFLFSHFWGLGFTNPVHDNPVQVSNNYDMSLEKHLKGTDITFKLSPYYRYTTNQLITVSLGGNFASGVNAATQKSSGVELAISKGDPSREGFSGQIAYTYAKALQKYAPVGGQNAIQVLNDYVCAFDALTSTGAPSTCVNAGAKGSAFYCANGLGTNGSNGASPTGTAAGCGAANAIANPYFNSTPGVTQDPNGWYPAYVNNPPDSVGGVDSTQTSPNQFTGFLAFKKQKLQVVLNGTLQEGATYGSPIDFQGYDPRACTNNQGNNAAIGAVTDTPANADYQTCGSSVFTPSGQLAVPNPVSGAFSGVGALREPWQLNLGAQINYDITPRIKATLVLANIYNRCFGGQIQPGATYTANNIDCGWNNNGAYLSNYYYGSSPSQAANGTAGYPGIFNQTYSPVIGGVPFQAYFNVQIKL